MVVTPLPVTAAATPSTDDVMKVEVMVNDAVETTYYADFATGWNYAVGKTGDITVKLLADWTATGGSLGTGVGFGDGTAAGTGFIRVPAGKNIILNLNGKTIDRKLSAAQADGRVITVYGNLTLNDTAGGGKITGGKVSGANNHGGGIYIGDSGTYGTLTMNGGSITGNTAEGLGGGVFVSAGTIFTMNGGTITGNTAGTGKNGGGVFVDCGRDSSIAFFNVSGYSKITGNTVGGAANNLYLMGDSVTDLETQAVTVYNSVIKVVGALTEGAEIGVSTALVPTDAAPIVAAEGSGYNITSGDAEKFKSDNTDYKAELSGTSGAAGAKVVLSIGEVWVGNTNVTTGYETEKSLYDGLVQYKDGVLTLNKITVPSGDCQKYAAVYSSRDLTIIAYGDNQLKGPSGFNISYGIYTEGTLTIERGNIYAIGDPSDGGQKDVCYGVYAKGGLNVTGGVLYAKAYSAKVKSCGIYSGGDISFSNGRVTAYGGSSYGMEISEGRSYGVYANGKLTVSGTADFTGKGIEDTNSATKATGIYCCGIEVRGDAEVTGDLKGVSSPDSCGVECNGDVILTGGTLTGIGGTSTRASGTSAGISFLEYDCERRISGNAVINGTAGAATGSSSFSIGILTGFLDIFGNAAVTGTGGAASNSIGISIFDWTRGTTVSGSASMTGNGAASKDSASYGIWMFGGDLKISENAKVTAKGETSTSGYSSGLWLSYEGNLEVSGNAVLTGTAKTGVDGSSGILVDKDIILTGGHITASGETRAIGVSNISFGGTNWYEYRRAARGSFTRSERTPLVLKTAVPYETYVEIQPATPVQADNSSVRILTTEGAGGIWKTGSTNGLSFTFNAPLEQLLRIEVDGKPIDAENYTLKSGGTIVTLKPAYLKTLSVGKHTLRAIFTSGEASTVFTISSVDETNPNTGAESAIGAVAAAAVLSLAVLAVSKKR